MIESRYQQHKASGGRFLIVDGHGFESVLRGAMEFECQPSRTRDRSRDDPSKHTLVARSIRSALALRRGPRTGRSSQRPKDGAHDLTKVLPGWQVTAVPYRPVSSERELMLVSWRVEDEPLLRL